MRILPRMLCGCAHKPSLCVGVPTVRNHMTDDCVGPGRCRHSNTGLTWTPHRPTQCFKSTSAAKVPFGKAAHFTTTTSRTTSPWSNSHVSFWGDGGQIIPWHCTILSYLLLLLWAIFLQFPENHLRSYINMWQTFFLGGGTLEVPLWYLLTYRCSNRCSPCTQFHQWLLLLEIIIIN